MSGLSQIRKVDQTIFAARDDGHAADGTPGDCYRACLAMLGGTTHDEAPHAILYLSWFSVARRWIRERNDGQVDLLCYEWDGTFDLYGDGVERPVIASGPSPRGSFRHCVIANSVTGEIYHDPHPSRAGLLSIDSADAVVPIMAGAPPLEPVLQLAGGAA